MSTAPAPAVDLQTEVAGLQKAFQEVRAKREAQKTVVAALESETAGIASQIAANQLRPQAASEHRLKVEQAKTLLEGLTNLTSGAEARFTPKYQELGRQRKAAADAAEFEEIETLKREGAAILTDLTATLTATVGTQMAKYTEIRRRLGKIMDAAARTGSFPIPATAVAARTARGTLDLQLAGILAPVEKMLR
jgi:hypothetical protein